MSIEDELEAEFDEGLDPDEFEDEIAGEGNRIAGARAQAVTEFLARELAEDSEAIDVTVSESRGEVTLLIHASPDDLGRLIGRRGRVDPGRAPGRPRRRLDRRDPCGRRGRGVATVTVAEARSERERGRYPAG